MFQGVWRLDDRSNLDQTRKYLYGKENNQHIRHSKPDKFGLSIQSYLFIYFDMKHRGSRQYVHENNGHCNIPETSSNDTIPMS